MTDSNSNGSSPVPAAPTAQKRRTPVPFIILALLFVIVPFLTWYLTWFGRNLSNESIGEYLKDETKVRHVQQALAQIEAKIESGDDGAKRWYPQIVALADSKVVEIRKTVAWVMGQDNRAEEFHAALLKLLKDAHPGVRRNAALQLVRFGDVSGRSELRSTLKPYEVVAPADGSVSAVLSEGVDIRENVLLARISYSQNQVQEIRAPIPGKLAKVVASSGTRVSKDDVLLTIAPDPDFVYEALRGLLFIGEAEDLQEVEKYVQGVDGMPEKVQRQAAQTSNAIRGREEKKPSGSKQ